MKKLLVGVLGVFLLGGLSACGSKKTIAYEKIDYDFNEKGVLKTSIMTSFTKDRSSQRIDKFYNNKNLVLFEYRYEYNKKNKEWKLNSKISNTYNANGLIFIKIEENSRLADPITTTYKYNSNDLIISTEEIEDGEITKTTYDYDYKNNLIEKIEDGPRDYRKNVYEYDDKNRLIYKTYYYSGNGGYSWMYEKKCETTYDENSRVIKEETTNKTSEGWKKGRLDEYGYDEFGNLSFQITSDPDDDSYVEMDKVEYKYDKKNNLIKETEYTRGNKWWSVKKWNESFKTKYEYDNNKLISKTEYSVNIWGSSKYTKTEYFDTDYE